MKFTLVTTCLNEIKSLPAWQNDLSHQTRQPDEICIVDAESTDGTRDRLFEWAKNDPRVKVRIERCNVARGRNLAITMATYEHIVSTDMGVRLHPLWFEELIHPFEEDATVQVVAGSTQIDRQTVKSAAARAEYYIENGGEPTLGPGFVPGNRSMAYTKQVWQELGGLPEDLTMAADDSVFGRQIIQGEFPIAYSPRAMTYWARPQRLRQFWREQYVYGIGHGEADIKVPAAFRWYLKGYLPQGIVPLLTACRTVQKHVCTAAIWRALKRVDIVALLIMPILAFGNGYCLAKGHSVGYRQGEHKCTACRARLKRPLRV